MIFNDSKYTNTYFRIVNHRQNNPVPEGIYSERHHIIPKSLGGSDDPDNLVRLTGKEHYICHLLLTKMVEGEARAKMIFAWGWFLRTANNNPFHGDRQFTIPKGESYERHRRMIVEANRQKYNDPEFKKKHSEKTKQALSTPEAKANMSRARKEVANKPGWREMISEYSKKNWLDDDYRNNISKKIKDKWQDPEYRSKQESIRSNPENKKRRLKRLREVMATDQWKENSKRAAQRTAKLPGMKELKQERMNSLWSDEEWKKENKARISEAMKKKWQDPEYRETMIRKRAEKRAAKKAAALQSD